MFDAGAVNTIAGGSTYGTMGSANTGGLALYAGSNIGLSQSTSNNGNASITIIGAAGGGGGGGGVAIVGGGATYSSGTVSLNASGALTIASTTGTALNLSVPVQSSLSVTGALSVSTNGSTISLGVNMFDAGVAGGGAGTTYGNTGSNMTGGLILYAGSNIGLSQVTDAASNASVTIQAAGGGGGGGTISNWEPITYQHASFITGQTYGNGSIYFYKMQPPFNVSASQFQQLLSISASTTTAGTNSLSFTMGAGIYTVNGSSLSLITQSSGSVSYSTVISSAAVYASLTGLKAITMPINVNMTPGQYWIGIWSRFSSSSSSVNQTLSTYNYFLSNSVASFHGLIGQSPVATQGIQEGVGVFTSTSASLPTVAPLASIVQSAPRSFPQPYIAFKNMTF